MYVYIREAKQVIQQVKKRTYLCMHACMHVCMYTYMYVCIYICIHTYMHACMHAYIYISGLLWKSSCTTTAIKAILRLYQASFAALLRLY